MMLAKDLQVKWGDRIILRDINLAVSSGEIVALARVHAIVHMLTLVTFTS